MTKLAPHEVTGLLRDFNRLKVKLRPLLETQRRKIRDLAPDFVLLRWLGLERAEWAHSKIIKNLLDPRGTHGQGTLFVESFLKCCQRIESFPIRFDEKLSERRTYVDAEVGSALGRPDLRIVSRQPDFVVIIENKIDQHDQTSQLLRYRDILRNDYGWALRNVALIYLTPSGHKARDPKAISIPYVRMSYREHVSQWLKSGEALVKPLSLRVCLREYVSLVEGLTEEMPDESDEQE